MTAPAIEAVGLGRDFGAFHAVSGVSFSVEAGEIFGYLGANGAGKSTTIRILCGLLEPSSGSAEVAGIDVRREPERVKRAIGYMSQRFSLYSDLTVDENLRFWAGTYRLWGRALEGRLRWAREVAELERRRRTLVRELPGGFRQRLALACCLLHEPPVVFLDEPTGGVDPEARRRFWDLIDELSAAGTTVFVTTHSMDEAERCHRVALMHAGRLLALDTPTRLKAGFAAGTVLEIGCALAARALARLESLPGVANAALFGDRLHAVVDDPTRGRDIESALDQAGFAPVTATPIAPSLEDVFIRAIREASREGAA